ncbi:MAG: S8 family serine peptidase [Bacteroidetes bacterium]|nr:S8 family serine peptidase [Bacteroidota bacterium]
MKFALAFLLIVCTSSGFAQNKYWVFFKDKPNAEEFSRLSKGESAEEYLVDNGILTQRAIERRLKVLSPSQIVSTSDFPVYSPYLDSIKSVGLTITGTSRWFNAAAVIADSAQLTSLEKFPFVVGIKEIVAYTVPIKPINPIPAFPQRLMKGSPQPGDSSFYGPSLTQLALSGIPQVQALGINGKGVLIGMLDAGFRYEAHDALKNIKIVGEHDFIQNDSITENQPGDAADQDNHGTSTLSVLGGYSPGNIIGVAYGSDFMLAKTEYVPVTDFKWEEDNWVEGIEWMEARGVDVVSSSVGYNIFVDSSGAIDSSESYFWSRGDFNGRKALASRAATRAARLGVVVVQAMGNEGNGNGTVGTMLVPADADSIISVGAVNLTGRLASFSSTGPTNDGRIKPDLVADGVDDYVAVVPGPDTYAYESGTSFSTPITAGIAALILSVRPNYTPMQVINLLKSTAVEYHDPQDSAMTAVYPNNFYGWGIVNAWNAIKSLGFVGSNNFTFWQKDSSTNVAVRAFSTAGINVGLSKAYYSFSGRNYISSPIFSTDTLHQYAFTVPPPISLGGYIYFYFDLVDSNGNRLDVPYYGLRSPFKAVGWMLNPQPISGTYLLFNNYPNPFNSQTYISFVLKDNSNVEIDVYDVLGRKVKTIFSGNLSSGFQEFGWSGSSSNGEKVASGVYFIRIDVNGSARILKALYLK